MAFLYIGRINILATHNGHTEGDEYTVSFDADTTSYRVYRASDASYPSTMNGIYQSDLPLYPNYEREDWKVEIIVGINTVLYFNPIESFPYWETKSKSIIDGGVNDLILSVSSITSATNNNNDGEVVLSATGVNSPFQYKKGDGAYQESATFSNLYSGEYLFTCQDANGNTRSLKVAVPSDEVPIENTTHGVKYRGDFYQFRENTTTNGIRHRVEILERDYSGSVNTLTLGSTPISISVRSEQSDYLGDSAIVTHELNVELLSSTFREYLELGMGDDYQFMVLYYIDDSVSKDGTDYNVRFKGFITPESYAENFGNPPYMVAFTASDRLADLQSINFYESGVLDQNLIPINTRVKGSLSQLTIIDKCLRNIKMSQGYRIAVDMFEESFDATSTDIPLNQAYENCKSFYNNNTADSCADVIRKILKPYGAFIMSWNNFWYIIKEEQLKSATVNYVEFDTFDDGTPAASSYSPRITHKAAGNSSLFRYTGYQTLNTTRAIKTINVSSIGKIEDSGITNSLTEENASFDENGNFTGFDGFELVVNNAIRSRPYNELVVFDPFGSKKIVLREPKITGWSLRYAENYNTSDSYIRLSNTIEWRSADEFELGFDLAVTGGFGSGYSETTNGAPYYIMRWQFKLGSYYLTQTGDWSLTATTNQYFISQEDINNGNFSKFNISGGFRDTLASTTYTDTYELKIYPVSAWDYDLEASTKALAITALEAVSTTSLEAGARRILRYTNSGIYYFNYYELRNILGGSTNSTTMEQIKPGDTTAKMWVLVSAWGKSTSLDSETQVFQANNIIKNFKFVTFPLGLEPPTKFGEAGVVNYENNLSLQVELDSFDLTNDVTNDEALYVNYTRRSDGTPTTIWDRLGGVTLKSRQSHLLDRLYELYRTPRLKISASFYSDLEVSALNTLYVTEDDARIFALSGVTINPKSGVHSGELIEISSSETPTRGDFNNDYDTDNDYF